METLALFLCNFNILRNTIIVGYGLAGYHYAKVLEDYGKEFLIISDDKLGASRNAGGILNPTIIRRFTLSWNSIEFYRKALLKYKKHEKDYGNKIFHTLPIHNYFNKISDNNNWSIASNKKDLNRFFSKIINNRNEKNIKADYGYGIVTNVGRVEIIKMLDIFKSQLDSNSLLSEPFDYNKLIINKDYIDYKGIKASKIIFCEGFGLKNNPWFSYLPLIGSKGEFIHIRTKNLSPEAIIKGGLFIVPIEKEIFWVGATFDRKDKTDNITKSAKEWILKKLHERLNCSFEVVHQGTGMRPTVIDRRPLLGVHPLEKRLFVFNGLGTRGLLMGPLLAEWLYQFIEENKELPTSVTIDRFQSYFSSSFK